MVPETRGALGPDAAFRRWAWETPDAVAVRWREHSWTYQQLDTVVAALAADLGRHGVVPGGRVALLFDPGVSRIAAMLAVLRSGAAYVPLDPVWPDARLRWVLGDVRPVLALVEPALEPRARALGVEASRVWEPAMDLAGLRGEPPAPESAERPEDLAYILYTSGSTGTPKGVMQSGVNALEHARAYADALDLVPRDRLSLVASYCFDAAVMDIFGALASGAVLCLAEPRATDLVELPAALARHRVTVLHLTPTLYRHLLARPDPLALPELRAVVLGGEEVTSHDVAKHRAALGRGVALINAFGPTECTTALWHRVDLEELWPPLRVPLGRPLPGIEVELEAEPQCGAGDEPRPLVLHSSRVALGYWQRPEETRRAFPVTGVFRTGDFASRDGEGRYAYRGRRDGQVKIRGQRVEIGEVEAVLEMVPGVERAVVVASRRRLPRLLAYLQPLAGAGRDDRRLRAAVRRHLEETLPSALIPGELVIVESLPRTASGKVDRARLADLPEPPSGTSPGPSTRCPRIATLAAIWSEVLACDLPGPGEGFFELGGDSLDAAQVVVRVREALGAQIGAASLFRHPTLGAFAEEVRACLEAAPRPKGLSRPRSARPAPEPEPAAARRRQPLSGAQRRYWARLQREPESRAFNLAVSIRIEGPLDARALQSALRTLVARHDTLRSSFEVEGGEPWLRVAAELAPGALGLPQVDLGKLEPATAGYRLEELGHTLAARPFALDRAPLLRCVLVSCGRDVATLLVSWHHLILDGWSRLRFEDELFDVYAPLRRRSTAAGSATPPEVRGTENATEIASGALASSSEPEPWLPPGLELPAPAPPRDHPARGGSGPAASCSRSLPEASRARLRELVVEHRLSPFMVFTSLFGVLLASWSGAPAVVVTSDVTRRSSRSAERLLGLLSDVLVLPLEVEPECSLIDLCAIARRRVLAAHDLKAGSEEPACFADLLDRHRPGALAEYERLFPFAVFVEQAPCAVARPGGLVTESRELPAAQTSRDLILVVTDGPVIDLTLAYRADAYEAATAESLLGRFLELAEALLDRPREPWGEVLTHARRAPRRLGQG